MGKYKVYRFIGDFVISDYDICDAQQKAKEFFGDCVVELIEEEKERVCRRKDSGLCEGKVDGFNLCEFHREAFELYINHPEGVNAKEADELLLKERKKNKEELIWKEKKISKE